MNTVSIHPYFKVHAGQLDAFKALLPKFVKKAATEEKILYYDFTINGDEVFCREAYAGAEGLLAHIDNVGALLGEATKIASLTRVEIHGPAAELEKLKGSMTDLKPAWFIYECGLGR